MNISRSTTEDLQKSVAIYQKRIDEARDRVTDGDIAWWKQQRDILIDEVRLREAGS